MAAEQDQMESSYSEMGGDGELLLAQSGNYRHEAGPGRAACSALLRTPQSNLVALSSCGPAMSRQIDHYRFTSPWLYSPSARSSATAMDRRIGQQKHSSSPSPCFVTHSHSSRLDTPALGALTRRKNGRYSRYPRAREDPHIGRLA